jgi:membrane fusion protein, protease secretion system
MSEDKAGEIIEVNSALQANKNTVVQAYPKSTFLDNNVPTVDVNLKKYTRLGWFIILGGLGGFLAWACLAPLDKGVPMNGTVAVASSKKAIQHEIGGTVDTILVKDGDIVKAGDVLIRMNNVEAESGAETARSQYIAARTTQASLTAENNNAALILPNDIGTAKNDPRVIESLALQKQISDARQSALKSELSAIDENVAGLQAQIKGTEESLLSKKEQKDSINQQLNGVRDLANEGYMATNRVLELEQSIARINAEVAADMGNINRYKRQIAELNDQKIQRNQTYKKEVRLQMADAQKQAEAISSQLKGLDRKVQNVDIKAPVAGTIVGLNVFTKGAVIAPGFKIMDIVPQEDGLVVEGQLPVHLVDKVHPDLPVNMMFTAFNQNKTPRIPGIVTQVSADRFVDERTGQAYYKVVTRVAPEGLKMITNLKIRPGMPVDMFIKTGERTMMNYLLKPILDHLKLSMTEE